MAMPSEISPEELRRLDVLAEQGRAERAKHERDSQRLFWIAFWVFAAVVVVWLATGIDLTT